MVKKRETGFTKTGIWGHAMGELGQIQGKKGKELVIQFGTHREQLPAHMFTRYKKKSRKLKRRR